MRPNSRRSSFIASDNPRSENPERIIAEIRRGMTREQGTVLEIPDRRQAIDRAVQDARPGDLVLIAGKGHEKGQEFSDRTIPFDDRVVARTSLEALGWDGSGDE